MSIIVLLSMTSSFASSTTITTEYVPVTVLKTIACWTPTSTLETSDTITTTSVSSLSTLALSPNSIISNLASTSLYFSAILSSLSAPVPQQISSTSSTLSQIILVSLTRSFNSTYSLTSLTAVSSSSTSSTHSSSIISSDEATSTSSPECVISGHCNTYRLLACPGGDCFCGQDINNSPTCFADELCEDTSACSTDADCAANEACGVKDCCESGAGRCIRRMVGCLNSPAAKVPYWLPYSLPCKEKRSETADGEGIDHALSMQRKRLVC